MKITETKIDGVYIIEPNVIGDNRGWFMETYRADKMKELGLVTDYVQENHSYSSQKGTIRGLHYQKFPFCQTKLIRCTRGAILDVAVDLRKNSKTYKQHVAVELTEENKKQLYMARGIGHGFLTLSENVEIQYKVDDFYTPSADRSIRYDDPEIGIDWRIENPVLSDKDKNAPLLKDSDLNFDARVLVTGSNGQLGTDVVKKLTRLGIECIATSRADFDLTNEGEATRFISKHKPTAIIHCAAYTAVDNAEIERELCYASNVTATKNMAKCSALLDIPLVYISSDYVYGASGQHSLTEDSECNPINYYGETKLAGENIVREYTKKHFILRTSWVFGGHGNNFVKTMQRLKKEGKSISVIDDQVGSPTYTVDLASFICQAIFTTNYGVYNVSNEGYCSWAEFAQEILNQPVNKIKTSEYKTRAARPLNSRMDKTKLEKNGFKRLPTWQDALDRFKKE